MGAFVDKYTRGSTISDGGIVAEQFTKAKTWADAAITQTNIYGAALQALLDGLTLPEDEEIVVTPISLTPVDYTVRPKLGGIDLPGDEDYPTKDEVPDPPEFDPVPPIEGIYVPPMDFQVPQWNSPDKPDPVVFPPPPTQGPTLDDHEFPPAPAVDLPDPPELPTVAFPSAPIINTLEFTDVLPEESTLNPPSEFNWEEDPYNTPIWNDLLTYTRNQIVNPGQWLGVAVEDEIWERAQDRVQDENEKLYNEIDEDFGSRGYELPPLTMRSALAQAGTERVRNLNEINGKIMIEQAERAQKHTEWAIEKGIDLEKILRDFHNAQMNRSLDAAKAVIQASVDVYNAIVARYNLNIERFKAQVAVYEARQRAELTKVEIFKGQIEGARVTVEGQKALVDIYEAQISAQETKAKMYEAQVSGIKAKIEAEAEKVNIFRAQIEAYVAQLESDKVRYDIYGVEVEAEKAKAQVYESQMRGYIARVDAEKTIYEGRLLELEKVIKSNQLLVEKYKAELLGYTTEVDIISKKAAAIIQGFQAEVSAYNAETNKEAQYFGAKIKEMEARIAEGQYLLQASVARVENALSGYTKLKELEITGTESLATIQSQLAASAMNAVNASASISKSDSDSTSASLSNSLSESHNYEEE